MNQSSENREPESDEQPEQSCELPPEEAAEAAEAAAKEESAQGAEEDLEARLQEAERKAEESQASLLRAMAEMENLRKRAARETEQARQFAIEGFARDLLGVADNLDRALAHMIEGQDKDLDPAIQAMADGVTMIGQELIKALEKHGVKKVESLGQPFNPNFHQAVMQVPDADAKPDTVVQELAPGYVLNDRLLRPAMVGVAT
ncbi:nucleotide exchange factor GrpE [Magnetofaba australis]|uniref:Protein GrpE n=1 Tax=Magnetofaba australis IT-1 TaxID=1434232 RepID=A0A1Y2K1P3_9PROT|nr:nucleotide exchange factor GrpE [Magnetofaba australis]OSM01950.1 putative GrpE protein HSP-70 cofactor [Magnetofaba australis IT-1]